MWQKFYSRQRKIFYFESKIGGCNEEFSTWKILCSLKQYKLHKIFFSCTICGFLFVKMFETVIRLDIYVSLISKYAASKKSNPINTRIERKLDRNSNKYPSGPLEAILFIPEKKISCFISFRFFFILIDIFKCHNFNETSKVT